MSKKNVFASIIAVIILAGGVVAGVMLVRQQQELREKAAVPGGQARVSLFPTLGNLNVGDDIPVSVYFNTSGVSISSISLRLLYPFSETQPEVTTSNIEINPIIENSGNWNCPKKSITTEGQSVAIEIECANISATGYATSTDTLLATFSLTVGRIPQTNPFTLSFDPSLSIITQKSNGADILNIPDDETGTATFTVTSDTYVSPTTGPSPTATKVPTKTPTPSPTTTAKVTLTPTPTRGLTVTPTKTPTPTTSVSVGLPDAGFSAPTYIGLGLGFVLIIAAVLLAI